VSLLVLGAGGAVAAVIATGGDDGDVAATGGATSNEEATETASSSTDQVDPASVDPAPTVTVNPPAVLDLEWTRVESPALRDPAQEQIHRVAVTQSGELVAVGSQWDPGERDATFWALGSPGSGLTPGKELLEAVGEEVVFGVAAIDGDRVVAVGYRQLDPPGGDTDAAAWLLRGDGWEEAQTTLASPGYEQMNRVVSGADGQLVAVGAAGPGAFSGGLPQETDAAVWSSPDGGAIWSRVDESAFRKDGYQVMRGVTSFGEGFVAVGQDAKGAGVWRLDGGLWAAVEAQPDLSADERRAELDMRDVDALGAGLVAVGDVATSAGDRDAAVWLSDDGDTWVLVSSDAFGGSGHQQILGAVTGDFGIVAVGCSRCDSPDATPAVWTSVDGQEWVLASPAVQVTSSPAQLSSVEISGSTVVAVGWEQGAEELDGLVATAELPAG
jgi:hypothetical protein